MLLPKGSLLLVLIDLLSPDDLVCHFYGHADGLCAAAVAASELLLLSKLWQDVFWNCTHENRD